MRDFKIAYKEGSIRYRWIEEVSFQITGFFYPKKPQKTGMDDPGGSPVHLKNPYNRLNIGGVPYIDTSLC